MAAAAAVDAEPPIGGAESRDSASVSGELGTLDAMEHGDELEELELGEDEIWRSSALGLLMDW